MSNFFKKAVKKVEKVVGNPVKDVLKYNPVTSPIYYGANQFAKSMAKHRQDINADQAALEEQKATMDTLGQSELDKYNTGALTEGEQANIDKTQSIMRAQLAQALGSAGISDSTMMVSGQSGIEQTGTAMKEQVRETHWDNAMKAMGLEADVQNQMHQMSKENMDANINMFSSLMNTLTSTAAYFSGKGSSGSELDSGSEGIVTDDTSSFSSDLA